MLKINFRSIIMCLIAMISISAYSHETDKVFGKRLLMRHGIDQEAAVIANIGESNPNLEILKQGSLDYLLFFAESYDLLSRGFSYEKNPETYVVQVDGKTLYYFYTVNIIKDNVPMTRNFYEVSFRVDGALYISRTAHYDYE